MQMRCGFPRTRRLNIVTFLERMWRLENAERPGFMFGYVGPKVKRWNPDQERTVLGRGHRDRAERLQDPEMFLQAQLEELEGDRPPAGRCRVRPSVAAFGVVSIPSAFGSEVVWWEDNLPAVHPGCDGEAGSR